MRSITSDKSKLIRIIKKAGVIAAWLLLWQLAALAVGSSFLFPSPLTVLRRLGELCVTKEFALDCLSSLGRISLGCFSGIVFGSLLGAATAFSKPLYDFFSPLLTVIKTTPVASFIILLLVWVKRSGVPVVIAFLMVVPVMWSNVSAAVVDTDRLLLEAAKVFRLSRFQKLRHVYIPCSLPSFAAGCKTSIGFSWKAGIAAEVLSTPRNSVGSELYIAKINLEYADLFAWTAAVILMSFLVEKALVLLLEKLLLRRVRGGEVKK